MRERSRTGALDGLRGLAAAAIVLLHTWMFHQGHLGHPDKTVRDLVIGELRLGLVCFFVLSGFLMARPFVRAALDGTPAPPLGAYLGKRAARILPAYYLAGAGAWILLTSIGHPNRPDPEQLPLFALFLQNHVAATANALDPPMWTLAVEVSFYLALPALAWAAMRTRRPPRSRAALLAGCAGLVAAGLAVSAVAAARGWPETVTSSLLTYLPVFACGMAGAVALHGRSVPRHAAWLLLAAGAALVVLDGVWHVTGLGIAGRAIVRDVPAALGFALIVTALTGRPASGRLLATRPLVGLGTVSYGVYLWHFPLIQWLRGRELMPDGLWTATALVLGLSVVAGALSWLLVERPVLLLAERTRRRRRAQASTRTRTAVASESRTPMAVSTSTSRRS